MNAEDASTYAFKLSTDTNKVCAIKVELTTQIDNALYSNFDVTIYKWSGSNGEYKCFTYTNWGNHNPQLRRHNPRCMRLHTSNHLNHKLLPHKSNLLLRQTRYNHRQHRNLQLHTYATRQLLSSFLHL